MLVKDFLLRMLNIVSVSFFFIMFILSTSFSCWAMEEENENRFSRTICNFLFENHRETVGQPHGLVGMLPREILHYIFSFLTPEQLGKIARVSKEWKTLSEADSLWIYCGVKSKKEYKENYASLLVSEVLNKDAPYLYTHHYTDPYYLPFEVHIVGTRNFRFAEGQEDLLKSLILKIFKKASSSNFKANFGNIEKIIKCIAIHAFEKNANEEDRYAYLSSQISKNIDGKPLILIKGACPQEKEIQEFADEVFNTRKGIFLTPQEKASTSKG